MSEKIQWTKTVERKQVRRLVVAVTSLDDGCCENYEDLTDEDLETFRGDFLRQHLEKLRERDAWKARAEVAEKAIVGIHTALDPLSARRVDWTPQLRREAIAEMLSALAVSQ